MLEFSRFLDVARALYDENVDYVLFGGAALNAHGVVRATEDVDLFVKSTDENIERLRRALRRLWNDPEIDKITFEDLSGDYPAVRYGPPDENIYLDILSRLGELYSFDNVEAEEVVLHGVRIRVATPRMLYRMKCNTVRPKDRADALALAERFHLDGED